MKRRETGPFTHSAVQSSPSWCNLWYFNTLEVLQPPFNTVISSSTPEKVCIPSSSMGHRGYPHPNHGLHRGQSEGRKDSRETVEYVTWTGNPFTFQKMIEISQFCGALEASWKTASRFSVLLLMLLPFHDRRQKWNIGIEVLRNDCRIFHTPTVLSKLPHRWKFYQWVQTKGRKGKRQKTERGRSRARAGRPVRFSSLFLPFFHRFLTGPPNQYRGVPWGASNKEHPVSFIFFTSLYLTQTETSRFLLRSSQRPSNFDLVHKKHSLTFTLRSCHSYRAEKVPKQLTEREAITMWCNWGFLLFFPSAKSDLARQKGRLMAFSGSISIPLRHHIKA